MPDFAKGSVQTITVAPHSNLLAAQTSSDSFALARIEAPTKSPQPFQPCKTYAASSLTSLCLPSTNVLYHADSRGAFHRHAISDAPTLQYSVDAAHSGHELTTVTALSSDSLVITAGKDGTVRCWDPETRQSTARLAGHRYEVRSVAASSSSDVDATPVTIVASGGRDKTIRLWDVRAHSSKEIHVFEGHSGWVHSVALTATPSPLLLSCAGDKTVRLWDLVAMKQRTVFSGHEFRVWSVAFSPDGSFAVSGSTDATVRLWSVGKDEGKCNILEGHRDSVISVAAHTPASVISGCEDGALFSWDCRGLLNVPKDAPLVNTQVEQKAVPAVSSAVESEQTSPRRRLSHRRIGQTPLDHKQSSPRRPVPESIIDQSPVDHKQPLIQTEAQPKSTSDRQPFSSGKPKHVGADELRSENVSNTAHSPSASLGTQRTELLKTAAVTPPQKDPRFDKSAAELVNALKQIQTLEKSLQQAQTSLRMKDTQIEQLNRSVAEKDTFISRLQAEADSSKQLLHAANVRKLFLENPRKADVALDYQEPVNKIGAVTDQLSALKARLDAMIATN